MISNNHIIFSLIFSLIFSKCAPQSSSNGPSYLLNCGNPNPLTDAFGRRWTPDDDYLVAPQNSTSAIAQYQDPSLPSSTPYMTSRIFPSETTYKFSISPSQRHWVRFYFYPSDYSHFKASESFFSLKAGDFTFLKNFSALITTQALTHAYIIKDFSLTPVTSGLLFLTFTPSSNYVAFVNGIEIVPMPEIFEKTDLITLPKETVDVPTSILETVYRLNVGGKFIPASNDSGRSRTWYDDMPYISSEDVGVNKVAANNINITYPSPLARFLAPTNVYRTAKTMGPTVKDKKDYNLTWVFQVDMSFTYMVRLHFCEFEFVKTNQRVFDIFINNQTAQKEADVMAWTGSRQGFPIHKDYAIRVGNKSGEGELWIALHPSVNVKSEYYDVILNGLEIFKVNDSNRNLAGPNPVPLPLKENAEKEKGWGSFSSSKNSTYHFAVIGGVLGGACTLVIIIGVLLCFRYHKAKPDENHGLKANSLGYWLPLYSSSRSSSRTLSLKSSGSSRISTPRGGPFRHFSLLELKNATKDFDENGVIGVGGFGKVYKGILVRGTKVAIKRSNPSSQQGAHEFQTEIDLLSKLRHKHLVSLIGACDEEDEMILVYDYMANGTLKEHVCKNINKPHFPWRKRLDICIGAARGIHYLHTGAKQTIIHRDVKSTNILLDEKWVAKVSDFGLSKTGINVDNTYVSTVVKGSFGYLDPEYYRRQQLTEKSDVYSFGVVLFEVLCGRVALNNTLPQDEISLADWAIKNQTMGTFNSIIDENVLGEINSECLNQFVGIAFKCLCDNGIDRPSMASVLWNLEFSAQLQDNPDAPKIVAEQKANDAFVVHTTLFSVDEEKEVAEEKGSMTFSMVDNLNGR